MPEAGNGAAPGPQPPASNNKGNNDAVGSAPAPASGRIPAPASAQRTHEARLAALHELHLNRSKWLQDLGTDDLSRSERKAATEFAFSILDADPASTPFESLRLAVENPAAVSAPHLRPADDEADRAPARAHKRRRERSRSPPAQQSRPSKTQKRRRDDSSSDEASESGHSGSSASDSSSSSDDSDSDSDGPEWEAGKVNKTPWNQLQVPGRIAQLVHRGEYVDLWWFTPTAGRMRHEEHKFKVDMGKVSLTVTHKLEKPKEFLPDEDLPADDFRYAGDAWTRVLAEEGIALKTVRRWRRFNHKIQGHPDRYLPRVQRALQLLHQHQRRTFATRTRQQKAELDKLKKKKLTAKQRRKMRTKLKRFDPGKFPTKTFQEIKDALRDEHERLN